MDKFGRICWYVSCTFMKNIQTESFAFAGSDMALDFVQHLMGPQIARSVRGLVEIPETSHRDDPFASIHGLL